MQQRALEEAVAAAAAASATARAPPPTSQPPSSPPPAPAPAAEIALQAARIRGLEAEAARQTAALAALTEQHRVAFAAAGAAAASEVAALRAQAAEDLDRELMRVR